LPFGVVHTLTADIAFQNCANAAAAAYRRAPAYVTYHVATHVAVPSLGRRRLVERAVAVRTRDDLAVLQDLPKGRRRLFHSFPVPPTFDALSYFSLHWAATAHMAISAYVDGVQPITYAQATPAAADVVVVNLRYYRATYAPDSSAAPDGQTHITLRPFQFVTRNAPRNTFYFADLYINNADGLPSRVHFAGPDNRDFLVEYAMIQQHWVVAHAHYEETVFGPLRIGALHVVADALYDDFAFPSQAPDSLSAK
jgi:hypothetical protein